MPKGKRGNPNWGRKPEPFIIAAIPLTAFEKKVSDLKLSPSQYALSVELKTWVRRNANSRYVPEALLDVWGIAIDNTNLY